MKLYLSSFKLGEKAQELPSLFGENKKVGFIPNACDNIDPKNIQELDNEVINQLQNLGLTVEYLDLKEYFGETQKLREKIDTLGGVFVRGGNTFILRQAMKLSGFDIIFNEKKQDKDFVYAGYSAGICVLAPNFKALKQVDDPTDHPYPQLQETIWKGLKLFDYIILPHYKSNHPESATIDLEVKFCKEKKIPYKTLKDGEVIIKEI